MKHVLLSTCIANSICPTEIVRAIYQLGTHTVNFCLDDKAKKILVRKSGDKGEVTFCPPA